MSACQSTTVLQLVTSGPTSTSPPSGSLLQHRSSHLSNVQHQMLVYVRKILQVVKLFPPLNLKAESLEAQAEEGGMNENDERE